MKTTTVSHRGYLDNCDDFDEKLNEIIKKLESEKCQIHDIKFSTALGENTTVFSALVMYEQVPTRAVIIEKTK